MEPIGKLVGVLPFVEEAIKKRNKKLLDYDRSRSTVKKLIEKPSDDPTKLAKAEAEANQCKNVYEPLNHQLITEIPTLINMQVPYLNPSFEAIVKSQLAFNEGAYHKLDAIRKSFPSDSDRGLEGRVESVLQQMRELSICRTY
jgi:bridging integrator 3